MSLFPSIHPYRFHITISIHHPCSFHVTVFIHPSIHPSRFHITISRFHITISIHHSCKFHVTVFIHPYFISLFPSIHPDFISLFLSIIHVDSMSFLSIHPSIQISCHYFYSSKFHVTTSVHLFISLFPSIHQFLKSSVTWVKMKRWRGQRSKLKCICINLCRSVCCYRLWSSVHAVTVLPSPKLTPVSFSTRLLNCFWTMPKNKKR